MTERGDDGILIVISEHAASKILETSSSAQVAAVTDSSSCSLSRISFCLSQFGACFNAGHDHLDDPQRDLYLPLSENVFFSAPRINPSTTFSTSVPGHAACCSGNSGVRKRGAGQLVTRFQSEDSILTSRTGCLYRETHDSFAGIRIATSSTHNIAVHSVIKWRLTREFHHPLR